MRVLVTGGTGFLGGAVVREALRRGHEVRVLARSPERAAPLAALGVEVVVGDLTDGSAVHGAMEAVDAVVHTAAVYRVGADPALLERVNVIGTRTVIAAMRTSGVARGVYTSSLAVNSDTLGALRDEAYRGPPAALSAYDRTKWLAHHEVVRPAVEDGLPMITLMPGLIYGPGDSSQYGAIMRRAIAGARVLLPGPPAGVCWAYVDDAAWVHLEALERATLGETYIVAGPCATHREAYSVLERVLGRRLRTTYVPPAMLRAAAAAVRPLERVVRLPADLGHEAMLSGAATYYGDASKARRELGYAPRGLEQGLSETFGRASSGR